jgi:hypothetical protein
MHHYSDEAWVDFARELLPRSKSDRMRAHLESGCESCSKLHRLWTRVTEVARDESKYVADESAVVLAKGLFGERSWCNASDTAGGLWNLVFDSLRDVAIPVGVRSISSTARHLLYQSSRFAVDVRIDAESETTVVIAGQILATDKDSSPASRWQVTLLQSTITVGQTFTNDYGEFYFESENRPDLRIRIDAEEQQPFTLSLPD